MDIYVYTNKYVYMYTPTTLMLAMHKYSYRTLACTRTISNKYSVCLLRTVAPARERRACTRARLRMLAMCSGSEVCQQCSPAGRPGGRHRQCPLSRRRRVTAAMTPAPPVPPPPLWVEEREQVVVVAAVVVGAGAAGRAVVRPEVGEQLHRVTNVVRQQLQHTHTHRRWSQLVTGTMGQNAGSNRTAAIHHDTRHSNRNSSWHQSWAAVLCT